MAEMVTSQQVYCYKINTFTKTNNNDSKLHAAIHHAEQSCITAAAAAYSSTTITRNDALAKHQNTLRHTMA